MAHTLWESFLSYLFMGPGESWLKSSDLHSKYFYLLSHLASPNYSSEKNSEEEEKWDALHLYSLVGLGATISPLILFPLGSPLFILNVLSLLHRALWLLKLSFLSGLRPKLSIAVLPHSQLQWDKEVQDGPKWKVLNCIDIFNIYTVFIRVLPYLSLRHNL